MIKRTILLSLSFAIGLCLNAIPRNTIYYTTSNDSVCYFHSFSKLPWGMISNEYVDGQGIMTFAEDLNELPYYAFYDCKTLTTVELPEGIKFIDECAFRDCESLKSIIIPDSVDSIADLVFAQCISLESLEVSPGNQRYDSREGCNAIIETATNNLIAGCPATVIPSTVTGIGFYAFYNCFPLTSINIPSSVSFIDQCAFAGCTSLTSVTIPDAVTSINNHLFYNCTSLKSVSIPAAVTSIGEQAFRECTSLESINLPASLTTIGVRAFENCSALKSVEIPKSVSTVSKYAFNGCTSLESVKVHWSRPLSIPSSVFYQVNTDECILYVPQNTSMLYMVAPTWIDFVNIQEFSNEPDANTHFLTIRQGNAGEMKQVVELGKSYKFLLTQSDDKTIKRVTFNGKDVTDEVTDGWYTTPVINSDSELFVTYITADGLPTDADVNGDGSVNVNDISEISSLILYGAE